MVIVEWRSAARSALLVRHILETWSELQVVVVDCGGRFTGWPHPRLTIVSTPNLGYAGGNNVGFRTALEHGARWVVALNSDAYPLPGSLERLVETVSRRAELAACGAALVTWSGAGPETTTGTAVNWVTGSSSSRPVVEAGSPVEFACGAMVLFRAAALAKVGGFDANLFLYYEEIDWCERARAAGFEVTVDPGARALHLYSRSTSRAMRAVTYYRARNRLWVLRRYSYCHGVRFSPFRQLRTIAHALSSLVRRGRYALVVPYIRGAWDGYKGLPLVVDSDATAAAQQRWEAKDAVDRTMTERCS